LKADLGRDVELEPTRQRGQFEIRVDGRTVVSRKGGLLARLLGKPWPADEDVVESVRAACNGAGET